MELKVAGVHKLGLVMEGDGADRIYLSNKAHIPETKEEGTIETITYDHGIYYVRIYWHNPFHIPDIKVGDKIKFTRH